MLPLPADLLWLGDHDGLATLQPRALPAGVLSAGELPMRAVLQTARQAKPESGRYLTLNGLRQHLAGAALPKTDELVPAATLYQRDPRLGIGLDTDSRTAAEGQIYTTEGHAFSPPGQTSADGSIEPPRFEATGFLVGVDGAEGLLPAQGHLRLGGDGRSAEYHQVPFELLRPPTADIASARRFRVILQTPSLFGGWLLPGVVREADAYRLRGPGFSARLACAAIGRREVVSGWDLHAWAPKLAEAAVPAGSVYWFDEFNGDVGKLAAWVAGGLRLDTTELVTSRHAEGWNQAWLALWPHH